MSEEDRCYVYIIGTSTGAYKVGIAANPEKRHQSLKTAIPDPSKLLLKIQINNRAKAVYIEKEIHKLLKSYHSQGEWFKPPKNILGELILDLREKIESFRPESPIIEYQIQSETENSTGILLEDELPETAPQITPSIKNEIPVKSTSFEPRTDLRKVCMNCKHWVPDPDRDFTVGLCSLYSIEIIRVSAALGGISADTECRHERDEEKMRIDEGRNLHVFEVVK